MTSALKGISIKKMAFGHPYSYLRLPIPAIYIDTALDVVALEGVNLLMGYLKGKEKRKPKRVILKAPIGGESPVRQGSIKHEE